VTLTFNSSEEIEDFSVDDVTVTGGILSNFFVSSASIYTATFTSSVDGDINITVSTGTFLDAAGNSNNLAFEFNWIYEEQVLNIDLIEQSKPLVFHPNPVRDMMFVNASKIKKVEVLEMFNLSGKKVLIFLSNVGQVDLTGLSEGIYLIRSKNNLMSPQKIIISK
jgi:hypothetical protein